MGKAIFLVHEWETADNCHHLNIWDGSSDDPQTKYFKSWSEALDAAHEKAEELGLDCFQVDHPDFPHKFIKVIH